MKSRESRKIDHIKYALHLEDGPCATGFSDIQVFHRALPQADRRDIDLSTTLPGIGTLSQPLVINAITGGAEAVKAINGELAAVARETGCAMAVGSQYGAVRKGMYEDTFAIARQVDPKGLLFANVSALASPDEARRAVDMIQAQALQIHLNSAQELAMEEGDRDFSHWLEQIEAVCAQSEVPVIVKETGCGMAREDARRLLDCGVSILDTGGAGEPISRPSKAAAIRKGTRNSPTGGFPRPFPFWKWWKPRDGKKESSLPAGSGRLWMCSRPGCWEPMQWGWQAISCGWSRPAGPKVPSTGSISCWKP